MSNIQVNYPCGRPPIPPPYTQQPSCTNTVSSQTNGPLSYHNNNGAAPTGAPVYPSTNAHHHRRHSGNMRYTPYQHPRQTSAAAPGAPITLSRPTTGGHDGHAADVPYSEHNRRSLDGAMYYPGPVPVRLAPTYPSQPPFVGHAAPQGQGQGESRVHNANEGSVQSADAPAPATATTYPHEQHYEPFEQQQQQQQQQHFVPSSAFPATPAPLVTFDSLDSHAQQYAKQSVHLTENEYSYEQQQQHQQQQHQQQQRQQQQYYHHPDGIQSIAQPDIGVSDDSAAAGLIHSLFTDSNSLDMNLSAGYTPTCRPDRLASLSFSGSFQGTHPQHVYGHPGSTTLDLSAAFVAPAPYGGLQEITSFTPLPGGDCPTPGLVPPTPKTGSSSSFMHPVPLPCNEFSAGGYTQCTASSEPATPPFLVPSSAIFAAPPAHPAMPYDAPLPPPPSTKPRREAQAQAHTPADLVRDPTLKFLPSQRAAAARAFEHVKSKPNVPIPTAFLGAPLSSAVVMKDGVQRARCLCEGCVGIGDDSGQGEGWRRLDHLWCHMRKEHFGCVVYRCAECPAAFSRNNDLKRHAATHESPLYSCDVGSCTAQYTRKDNLRRHIMQKHHQVSVM